VEILLSLGIKLGAVVLLGAPALGVLLFEVFLNATSLFNHGNVRLPAWLDRVLRLVVVTPQMHRVHHSVNPRDANSNFGFDLPSWDYGLGPCGAKPGGGREGMATGLGELGDRQVAPGLHGRRALPLLGPEGDYPVTRRGPVAGAAVADAERDRPRADGPPPPA